MTVFIAILKPNSGTDDVRRTNPNIWYNQFGVSGVFVIQIIVVTFLHN
jgi:hypothetical protein